MVLNGGILGLAFNFSSGEIKEGQDVSDLQLSDRLKVGDFKGSWLVLYFYPKDNTPGCTKEAKTFSSMLDDFHDLGAEIIGVSGDSEKSHEKFKEKHDLRVKLISDPNSELAKKFGIKVFFGLCSRDTVVINPDCKVEAIYTGVNPKAGAQQVYDFIKDKNLIRSTKTT